MKEFGGRIEGDKIEETTQPKSLEQPQLSKEAREKFDKLTGLDSLPTREEMPEGKEKIPVVVEGDKKPEISSEAQKKFEELTGLNKLPINEDNPRQTLSNEDLKKYGIVKETVSEENGDKDVDAENQDNDDSGIENNNECEDEKETRELTDEEKQWLKDTLGWSDKQIDKCTIDEDGVIHYRTDRSDLEGKTSENGVPYERKQIVINGVKIEGVFPKFDSVYTTELSPEKQKSNAYAKECNANLKEAVQNDPDLRSKFTKEQLDDIENGRTPNGYVWHHNEEQGKMELVKKSDHDRTSGGAAHTGGSVLWGPDSNNNASKGEKF